MKALNANAEEVIINLEELIGQGAEGKVYKATSARFDIPIVAKHQQIKASFQPILDSLIASIVIELADNNAAFFEVSTLVVE